MSVNKIKLKSIKLALLGDSTVGKTSICNSLKEKKFDDSESALPTIGCDKIEKKFKIKNGQEMNVIIFDTAGQERFRSVPLNTIKHTHGIIIVFDVTQRTTFDHVGYWLKSIQENSNQTNIVLFGNKTDKEKSLWKVTDEEMKINAEKYKLKYFETSAKTQKNLNEGFSFIVNKAFDKLKEDKNIIIDINDNKNEEQSKGGCFSWTKKKSNKKKNKN